ncbi:MAG: dihydrofolate reductase family protein [Methanosarcina sp.]
MRKIIAGINMTIDGFCDHTLSVADEELHDHYTDLLSNSGVILYGRITYKLMEDFWPDIIDHPTGDRSMDEFAVTIQNIQKIVFSRTLNNVGWVNAKLATRELEEEISELRQQSGKDILIGSPSLIAAMTKLNYIDEYQLCIHPIIAGKGLQLFKGLSDSLRLKLIKTKTFGSGAITLYYEAPGK